MKKYSIIIFITILFGIISFSEYVIYSSFKDILFSFSPGILKTFIFGAFLFPLLLLITTIVGTKRFSKLNSYLYTASAIWLGIIIYLFLGSIILTILLHLEVSYVYSAGLILFFSALAIVIYGIINASTPRIKKWKIKSDALNSLWSGKKIVLISDTHFGQVRQENFAKKVVDLLKKESPDIVFHAGDIIDGPSFPYKKSFDHLESLNPSLGFIYVEGNHERYSQEYKTFKSFFPKNITDVTDKKVIINETQIIGLSFKETESKEDIKKRLNNLEYDKSKPSIILLHDPKNSVALADLDACLVLSGHTHGGQFFPSNLIVKRIYKSFSHGVTHTNKTISVTTFGIGTAMVPIRVGTTPEIIILEIV